MSEPSNEATNPGTTSSSQAVAQQSTPNENPVVLQLVYENLMSSLSTDLACQLHRMMKTGVYPSTELFLPKSRTDIYPDVYSDEKDVRTEERKYTVFAPQRNKRKRSGDTVYDPNEEYIRESEAQIAKLKEEVAKEKEKAAKEKEKAAAETVAEDETKAMDTAATTAPDPATSDNANKQAPTPHLPATTSTASIPPSATSTSAPPAAVAQPQTHLDIWGKAHPKEPKEMVDCLVCGRQVNTLRFAPHLDKCMGIGTTVRAASVNSGNSSLSRGNINSSGNGMIGTMKS